MAMQGVMRPGFRTADLTHLLASRWLWCFGIVVFICARELAQGYKELLTSLGDTDDAMRLHQVRRLMETGVWFDMTLPRVGGGMPLISHWSRLIDLPLALLLGAFGLFLSPEASELTVRVLWPMLVLFVFLRLLLRAVDTHGGPAAGWIFLFLATTCLAGLTQFKIGRIDHHNVMILGSMAGLLLLLEARQRPEAGWLAGALIGLGLSVGYEPLANVLPALAVIGLWALWDPSWIAGVRNMGVAATGTMAAVFVATIAPHDWLHARCDALSLNMVLLFASGAAGLNIVARKGRHWTFQRRLFVVTATCMIGLAGFASLDSRCLAGPFAQTAPELKGVWLDHVLEAMSAFALWKTAPAAVISFFALIVAGIAAATERWRRLKTPETLATLVLMVLTAPTGLWMIKMMPYASWIAIFAIALSIADLKATGQVTALTRQLLAVIMLNQWMFAALNFMALSALGQTATLNANTNALADDTRCMSTPAIRTLAAHPRGLIVAPIDFGSFIVALTPHDVLAAPYHRIDTAILENYRILISEPREAQRKLTAIGADYVMVCAGSSPASAATAKLDANSLYARLKGDEKIDFLTPMTLDKAAGDLKLWRVVR